MNELRWVAVVLASSVALGLICAPAHALNARSFISANGNDASACTRPLPCRTLQVAHDKTSAGGEINMLDVAGFGIVTVTKSMSIVNDGVGSAGVLVPAGVDGITINAGATGVVNLRGLIIEGAGVGSSGITVISAESVSIQNCVIRNLVNDGIVIIPTATTQVNVSDTYVANNGAYGIVIQPNGVAPMTAFFNRVQIYNSGNHGFGLLGNQNVARLKVTVVDSVSAHNVHDGFLVHEVSCQGADPANFSQLTMLRTTSAFNGDYGIEADGPCAKFTLAASSLIDNPVTYHLINGGTGRTYGDNNLGGTGSASLAPLSKE